MVVFRKYILTFLLCWLTACNAIGQEIGKWDVYPSYWQATKNMVAGSIVYTLCGNNLLAYDTEDTSVRTFNCLEHLNGVHIACMSYSEKARTLLCETASDHRRSGSHGGGHQILRILPDPVRSEE